MANQMHVAPPKNLIILTNNMPEAVREGAKRAPKNMKVTLAPWSQDNMRSGQGFTLLYYTQFKK